MLLSALRFTRLGVRAAWLCGVLALIALTALPALLHGAGFDTYTVRGGSMVPALPLGAVVVVQPIQAESVGAGDVITFMAPNGTVVTHRVLGRTAGPNPTFITKGDANETPDPNMVPAASVIGRVVFSAPFVGSAIVTLSTTTGMIVAGALLVALIMTGWFIDELRSVIGSARRRTATELAG